MRDAAKELDGRSVFRRRHITEFHQRLAVVPRRARRAQRRSRAPRPCRERGSSAGTCPRCSGRRRSRTARRRRARSPRTDRPLEPPDRPRVSRARKSRTSISERRIVVKLNWFVLNVSCDTRSKSVAAGSAISTRSSSPLMKSLQRQLRPGSVLARRSADTCACGLDPRRSICA